MSIPTRRRVAPTFAFVSSVFAPGLALPAQDTATRREIPADTAVQAHPAGFKYSILRAGSGVVKPSPGDGAVIHFDEWLSDGTLVSSTVQKGEPFGLTVGDPSLPLALSTAPQLITKGGKVKLTVPPEKAYGRTGQAGRIPPNSTMVYVVELVDYQYRPKPAQFVRGDPARTKTTKSGLKYQIEAAGSGDHPDGNAIVDVEYTTWDLQGNLIFGTHKIGHPHRAPVQSHSHPFFHEILPMMKRGAVWRIVVPAALTVREWSQETVWNVKLLAHEKSPVMPPSDENASTSTKSGLLYQRLAPGTGNRPRNGQIASAEWDFWNADGTFISGSRISDAKMTITVGQRKFHKFLDETMKLMQIGEVMRVEVPEAMTAPQMLRFKTVWRLKLLEIQDPLPAPAFELPRDAELKATKSGLKYKVVERGDGEGEIPRLGQQVRIHYCAWLADGKQFDSSFERNREEEFQVGQTLAGMNEGLQLMKTGDSFLFVIPSKLAFGARGTPDGVVPPDATVVYFIKLVSVGR